MKGNKRRESKIRIPHNSTAQQQSNQIAEIGAHGTAPHFTSGNTSDRDRRPAESHLGFFFSSAFSSNMVREN